MCIRDSFDVARAVRGETGNGIAHAHAVGAVACRAHGGYLGFAGFDIGGLCEGRDGENDGQSENFFHGLLLCTRTQAYTSNPPRTMSATTTLSAPCAPQDRAASVQCRSVSSRRPPTSAQWIRWCSDTPRIPPGSRALSGATV